MKQTPHTITRQIFDFEIEDQKDAHQIQNRISQLFRDHLQIAIEQVLDELSLADHIFQFDRIELDLGELPFRSFEATCIKEIPQLLKKVLTEKINQIHLPTTQLKKSGQKILLHQSKIQTLIHFLQYGSLPENTTISEQSMEELFLILLEKYPKALEQNLKRIASNPNTLTRITLQFSPKIQKKLLQILAPQQTLFIESFSHQLERTFSQYTQTTDHQAFQNKLNLTILQYLLLKKSLVFDQKNFKQYLTSQLIPATEQYQQTLPLNLDNQTTFPELYKNSQTYTMGEESAEDSPPREGEGVGKVQLTPHVKHSLYNSQKHTIENKNQQKLPLNQNNPITPTEEPNEQQETIANENPQSLLKQNQQNNLPSLEGEQENKLESSQNLPNNDSTTPQSKEPKNETPPIKENNKKLQKETAQQKSPLKQNNQHNLPSLEGEEENKLDSPQNLPNNDSTTPQSKEPKNEPPLTKNQSPNSKSTLNQTPQITPTEETKEQQQTIETTQQKSPLKQNQKDTLPSLEGEQENKLESSQNLPNNDSTTPQSKEPKNETPLTKEDNKEPQKENTQTKLVDAQTKNQDTLTKLTDAQTKNQDTLTKLTDAQTKNQDTLTKLTDAQTKNQDTLTKLKDAQTKNQDTLTKLTDAQTKNQDTLTKLTDAQTKNQDTLTKNEDTLTKNQYALTKENDDQTEGKTLISPQSQPKTLQITLKNITQSLPILKDWLKTFISTPNTTLQSDPTQQKYIRKILQTQPIQPLITQLTQLQKATNLPQLPQTPATQKLMKSIQQPPTHKTYLALESWANETHAPISPKKEPTPSPIIYQRLTTLRNQLNALTKTLNSLPEGQQPPTIQSQIDTLTQSIAQLQQTLTPQTPETSPSPPNTQEPTPKTLKNLIHHLLIFQKLPWWTPKTITQTQLLKTLAQYIQLNPRQAHYILRKLKQQADNPYKQQTIASNLQNLLSEKSLQKWIEQALPKFIPFIQNLIQFFAEFDQFLADNHPTHWKTVTYTLSINQIRRFTFEAILQSSPNETSFNPQKHFEYTLKRIFAHTSLSPKRTKQLLTEFLFAPAQKTKAAFTPMRFFLRTVAPTPLNTLSPPPTLPQTPTLSLENWQYFLSHFSLPTDLGSISFPSFINALKILLKTQPKETLKSLYRYASTPQAHQRLISLLPEAIFTQFLTIRFPNQADEVLRFIKDAHILLADSPTQPLTSAIRHTQILRLLFTHKPKAFTPLRFIQAAVSHTARSQGIQPTTSITQLLERLPNRRAQLQNPDAFNAALLFLQQQTRAQAPQTPAFSLKIPYKKPPKTPARTYYINNAGIVLLNPFINLYFQRLKLMTPLRKFLSPEHAQRAAHYLQVLATKDAASPEHELLFNKLLCGLPLDQPIIRSIDPKPEELELANGLLKHFISQWKKMKNSSVDGLRGGFFIRKGKLTHAQTGKWILRVEQKPYDILLDSLPWSFNLIKLPCMEKPLYVEWR